MALPIYKPVLIASPVKLAITTAVCVVSMILFGVLLGVITQFNFVSGKMFMLVCLLAAIVPALFCGYLGPRLGVRHPGMVAVIAVLSALAASYALWISWVSSAYEYQFIPLTPHDIIALTEYYRDNARIINNQTSQSPGNGRFEATIMIWAYLATCAAMIVIGGPGSYRVANRALPQCNNCGCTLKSPSDSFVYHPVYDGNFIAKLLHENQPRSLVGLLPLLPEEPQPNRLQLDFYCCPDCGGQYIMNLHHHWTNPANHDAMQQTPLLCQQLVDDQFLQIVRDCYEQATLARMNMTTEALESVDRPDANTSVAEESA